MTYKPSGNPEGFVILDKSPGSTSHTTIARIYRMLGKKIKVGHAGTLDSFASGILICLFGRYTRLSDYFMNAGKSYEADIALGSETDTLDPRGTVIATAEVPTESHFLSVLPQFRGDILQAPPAYSAVHIDGNRAYQLALRGEDHQMEKRSVNISRLELLEFSGMLARIHVHCSKGTYIRSLARDIALACGSRGHLSALRRTSSGPFTLSDAITETDCCIEKFRKFTPALARELELETLILDVQDARAFIHGLPPHKTGFFPARKSLTAFAAFSAQEEFLGIAEYKNSSWRYAVVFEGATCG